MVDRQDIDALLIGSLYGELSSADEARLSAHLESHPADRAALANLTRAREIVHESRILQAQFEPPQSVSALLMQEAARRAPKARDEQSWFQRFMRSFLAHPAMAAAVMLVLVIGVAGTVYMKKGDNFAKATKEEIAAPPVETAPGTPAPGADDYKVKLDDQEEGAVAANEKADAKKGATLGFDSNGQRLADGARGAENLAKQAPGPDRDRVASPAAEPAKVAKAAPKPATKTPPRLEVTTESPAPKDFAQPVARDDGAIASRRGDSAGAAKNEPRTGAGGSVGTATDSTVAPTSPSIAPAPPPPPPPPAAATIADERSKQEKEKASTELAWAKERHGKAIAAVKAGKCELAASFVIDIANRVPGYYQSSVADDRALKSCAAYITAQREREAERAQRAKATQRRAVDEAPDPAPSSTK